MENFISNRTHINGSFGMVRVIVLVLMLLIGCAPAKKDLETVPDPEPQPDVIITIENQTGSHILVTIEEPGEGWP